MNQQKHNFLGGLDNDTALNLIAEGDYIDALNVRINSTESGNIGAVENIKGNVKISQILTWDFVSTYQTTLYPSTGKVVGAFEDRRNQRLIFFRFDDSGYHGIYRFEIKDGKIYEIFCPRYIIPGTTSNLLNFSKDKYITQIALYPIYKQDKLEHLLYWTDGINPQRCVNIDTIGKLFSDHSTYEDRFINLIKCPPVITPMATIVNDTSRPDNLNLLNKKCFQATYRYIYKDYQRSTWSPYSRLMSNAYTELANFDGIIIYWTDDIIDFTLGGTNQRYRDLIDGIEIAIRESYNEPFKLFKRIKLQKGESAGSTYFINDDKYNPVTDIGRPHDTIPLKSECLTGIDNRIMLGNNTEGFPSHKTFIKNVQDVKISPDIISERHRMCFKNGSKYGIGIVYYDFAGRQSFTEPIEELKINIPSEFTTSTPEVWEKRFEINQDPLAGGALPPEHAHSFQLVRTETQDKSFFVQGIADDVLYVDPADPTKTLKKRIGTAANRPSKEENLGFTTIRYNVKKENDLNENGSAGNYNGQPLYEGGVVDDTGVKVVMQTWVNNTVESDLYITNYGDVIGYTSAGAPIYYGGKDSNGNPISGTLADNPQFLKAKEILIDIKNWNSITYDKRGNRQPDNKIYYNFQEGDKTDLHVNGTVYKDISILSLENSKLRIPFDTSLLNVILPKGLLLEVFTPAKSSLVNIYYEFGHCYKINNPGTPNRTYSKTDFTLTNQAIWQGDVHRIKKKMYANGYTTPDEFYIYSMNPDSDNIAGTWERGNGRPSTTAPAEEKTEKKETQVRFSAQLVQDSKVNGTSTFSDSDQHIYPYGYGAINSLKAASNNEVKNVGNILLAHFSNETVSIYINRTTLEDLSGSTQVTKADRVLGSYNTLLGSFGCIHPESIVQIDERMYWWDGLKNVYVRYSRDGLTPISAVKMTTFFKNRGGYLSNKLHNVISGLDYYNDETIVTFIEPNLSGRQTLSWNENSNRWQTFYSFVPECYGRIGDRMFSFTQGDLYVHSSNVANIAGQPIGSAEIGSTFVVGASGAGGYNTFYGRKYDSMLEIVTNKNTSDEKVFKAISIEASNKWKVERFLTQKTSKGKLPMMSYLELFDFEQYESHFYAQILADINTPNVVFPIFNGDLMRGYLLRSKLVLDPSVSYLSVLNYVNIEYIPSYPILTK